MKTEKPHQHFLCMYWLLGPLKINRSEDEGGRETSKQNKGVALWLMANLMNKSSKTK